MKTQNKKPRVYRKITPKTVAEFKAAEALEGNGTAAVRRLESTRISPKDRAFRIAKKSEKQNTSDFINDQLQQIGVDAINRIGRMVNSVDEKIATKNSHYVVDRLEGRPMVRTESKHLNLTIETVLGGE